MDPRYDVFKLSKCRRARNVRELEGWCGISTSNVDRRKAFYSACEAQKLCVEIPHKDKRTAWCVDPRQGHEVFLVPPAQDTTLYRSEYVPVIQHVSYGIAIVLLEAHQRDLVYAAAQINIAAIDEDGSILGPVTNCDKCSSLTLSSAPTGTVGFEVHMLMRNHNHTPRMVAFLWTD